MGFRLANALMFVRAHFDSKRVIINAIDVHPLHHENIHIHIHIRIHITYNI